MRILPLLLLAYCAATAAQSVQELTQSAQNNNVHAQLELADAFSKGQKVKQSDSEAFYWYQQAAQNGSDIAATALGRAYYQGIGTDKNIEHAIFWLSQAAISGNAQAPLLLGHLYEQLQKPIDNLELAKLWYQQQAEQSPEAAENYARVLEHQFNARRAKQVAAIDQLEVAFDHRTIELAPNATPLEPHSKAHNGTVYLLLGVLILSIISTIWLLRTNRKLRALTSANQSDVQREQAKLDSEIKRKNETLKQQKRQMEIMYRHIKKLQAQPASSSGKNSSPQSSSGSPFALACALFGFDAAQVPSEKQIKIRYKQLSKIYHPDLKGSEEEMKRLNQALKVILKQIKQ